MLVLNFAFPTLVANAPTLVMWYESKTGNTDAYGILTIQVLLVACLVFYHLYFSQIPSEAHTGRLHRFNTKLNDLQFQENHIYYRHNYLVYKILNRVVLFMLFMVLDLTRAHGQSSDCYVATGFVPTTLLSSMGC